MLVSAVPALYFVSLIGGALLLAAGMPFWSSQVVSLVAAALVGRYVWLRTASVQPGLIGSMGLGAVILGAVGFIGGFFGPIIFMPGANQGPLLGIFITGPLGFVLGAIAGAIHWVVRGRHRLDDRREPPV